MKNIALIGYGALGHILTDAILDSLTEDYHLMGIYDQAFDEKSLTIQGKTIPLYKNFDALLADDTDLVVEIAGVEAVKAYVIPLLEGGKDVVITSVGSLADTALFESIASAAKETGRKVHITSGAIGGFDLMHTLTLMGGVQAEIQSTKAPRSLNGAPYLKGVDLPTDKKVVVFEGSADEAIKGFPKNTNVAVATGINTVGADATKVRIISDPESRGNTHRIRVENAQAKATVEITSKPDPKNPKSSVTAAWSVAALLKNLASPVQFF